MEGLDPYAQLGVPRDADIPTIRKAYRRKAKSTHPNAGGDADEWAKTSRALVVLTDPKKRRTFDDTGRIEEDRPDNDRATALSMVDAHVAPRGDARRAPREERRGGEGAQGLADRRPGLHAAAGEAIAMSKPADRPEPPSQKRTRPPEQFPSFTEPRTCNNCQHFEGRGGAIRNQYPCHNGISGRLLTRPIDGCGFGFYPNVKVFPLGPGAGGEFMRATP